MPAVGGLNRPRVVRRWRSARLKAQVVRRAHLKDLPLPVCVKAGAGRPGAGFGIVLTICGYSCLVVLRGHGANGSLGPELSGRSPDPKSRFRAFARGP